MPSRHAISAILFAWVFALVPALAQPNGYEGLRAALFQVEILQPKAQDLVVRGRIANTGRQTIGTKKSTPELVVEFDTLALPGLLRGHEPAIAEALRENCPRLKPGEISGPIWLNVRLREQPPPPPTGCADVAFDTVFVEQWGERTLRLRYFLTNKGSAPAYLYAKNTEPIVKIYFVSGTKLTRGAIPAGSTSIQKGRETLTGVLFAGQVLEGTIDIPLKDRSKFSPNIALEFDPAQMVEECGRSGNVWIVRARF